MAKKKNQTEKIDWTNRNKSQVAKCHQENYIFKEQIKKKKATSGLSFRLHDSSNQLSLLRVLHVNNPGLKEKQATEQHGFSV